MLILLSSAKIMASHLEYETTTITQPLYAKEAEWIAYNMAQFTVTDLEHMLKINKKLAMENYDRYRAFLTGENDALPAVFAYAGIVFKNLAPTTLSPKELSYAQSHIRFGSPLYGLLRPLDMIRPYRMEYGVKLPESGHNSMYPFWRDRLTDKLIVDTQAAGGTLINLAASDVLPSFDWKKVCNTVRVVTPDFKVWKNGKRKAIVVYLKMARGKISRFIIRNQIQQPDELKAFSWEGFSFQESLSDENNWLFMQE